MLEIEVDLRSDNDIYKTKDALHQLDANDSENDNEIEALGVHYLFIQFTGFVFRLHDVEEVGLVDEAPDAVTPPPPKQPAELASLAFRPDWSGSAAAASFITAFSFSSVCLLPALETSAGPGNRMFLRNYETRAT